MNIDDEHEDRLSGLPNCVLLHILSFLNTKEAVQICILSKRWKHLWKHLSNLTLSCLDFETTKGFNNFISHFLSLRDASTSLHALDFYRELSMKHSQLENILKYVVSHNVQWLQIVDDCDIEYFPPRFFSCHTLKSLNLTFCEETIFPNSLNLPSLTNLSLEYLVFRADGHVEPFSTFKSLNSLIILNCELLGENLYISSDTLVNFTIETFSCDNYYQINLSTPSLCSFDFTGIPVHNLSASKSNLSSIKHVNIDITSIREIPVETSLVLLNWLQVELANIESLTVSLKTLQILSLVSDLHKVDFSSLRNLKSLKVKYGYLSSSPDGIVDFLLQNAPFVKPA